MASRWSEAVPDPPAPWEIHFSDEYQTLGFWCNGVEYVEAAVLLEFGDRRVAVGET